MYQRRDSFFVSLNTALYFLTNVEMDLEKSAAVVDGDKINSGITSHAQELGIQVEKVRDVKGADLVLELADAEAVEIPEHMNKRILRKIDWVCYVCADSSILQSDSYRTACYAVDMRTLRLAIHRQGSTLIR